MLGSVRAPPADTCRSPGHSSISANWPILALGVSEQSTARAEAIRGHVADAREYLVELGRELTEIRDEIGDSERFAHFVADEFGWHGPEADQFMALAGAADAGTPPPAGEITLYALRAAAAAVEKVE
jgi:hypothetical protein